MYSHDVTGATVIDIMVEGCQETRTADLNP